MRNLIFSILCLIMTGTISSGQSNDPLLNNCEMNTGTNSRYLKDFRIKLGKANGGDCRYKVNMSLWKNTKYRFTLCNSADSKGKLILDIRDEKNRVVVSSYDSRTGKTFQSIDFLCGRSGIYQLYYDFAGGEQGSGTGIVSLIR
jgi:hypothetical protein